MLRIPILGRPSLYSTILQSAFIIFVLFGGYEIAAATEAISSGRAKIGLALSGGGARGIAHIGVLKKLEELRIPVDYISGTSMGSIIGGLYASGKSAEELEALIHQVDWESAFTDETPLSSLPMRRKIDYNQHLMDFELGLDRNGIVVPKGVLQGQNLHLILKNAFRDTLNLEDFGQLPIPFRAVASDIETGESVILGKGDLATSIQASMAVPGAFSPVVINGRSLVDGGVSNNLPIDVVRGMGADIVIAVDISTPLTEPEELKSALDILDQLTNFLNQNNLQKQLDKLNEKDIFIRPPLKRLRSTEFDLISEFIRIGSAAAADSLQLRSAELALNEQDYKTYRQSVTGKIKTSLVPDYIAVIQDSDLSSEALRNRLHTEPLKPIDLELLHKDIERIHGLGVFQSVRYHVQHDHGFSGLIINAKEKDWGSNYLKFGLQLEDDFKGDNNYNLSLGLSRKPVNRLGGELAALVTVGDEPKLSAEYFQPFNSLQESYSLLRIQEERFDVSLFSGAERIAEYDLRYTNLEAYLGMQYSNATDLRLGLIRSFGNADRLVGDEALPDDIDFDDGAVVLEGRYDSLDKRFFPTEGARSLFRYRNSRESLGAEMNYTSLELSGFVVKSLGQARFGLNYSFSTTLDDNAPVQSLFRLGGFRNLSGYSQNELGGQHAGLLGLGVKFPIVSEHRSLERPVYLGLLAEAGNVWQERSEIRTSNLIYSGTVYLGIDTLAGPAYFGYGQAEEGRSSFYFSLGYSF